MPEGVGTVLVGGEDGEAIGVEVEESVDGEDRMLGGEAMEEGAGAYVGVAFGLDGRVE